MVMHTSAARVTPAVRGSPGRRSDHCPGVRTPPGPLRGATPSTCPVRSRAPPAPPPGSGDCGDLVAGLLAPIRCPPMHFHSVHSNLFKTKTLTETRS